MALHNELGKDGEDLAAEYLIEHGYRIRHRNWRCGKKELDIVAQKDGVIVFVEVKTRSNDRFGLPVESVTEQKMRRLMNAANTYVNCYKLDFPVRFDILSIVGVSSDRQLIHIEDAFSSPVW